MCITTQRDCHITVMEQSTGYQQQNRSNDLSNNAGYTTASGHKGDDVRFNMNFI